jgi:hypothetical protein
MTELPVPASTATQDQNTVRRMPVDIEHIGIRIVVPFLAIAGFVIVLWGAPIILSILPIDTALSDLLLIPLAIAAAVVVAYAGDRYMKRVWPSGREILLDDAALVLRDRKEGDQKVSWHDRVNVLAWRFTVSRRGRVPKGHYCMALQIVQDEHQITAYTFLNPKALEDWSGTETFTPLAARKTIRDERLNMRVAGHQRRLLQAEDVRWNSGAELLADDFADLWAFLQKQNNVSIQG